MKSFQENVEYKATIDKHRRSKTFEDEDVVTIYLHKKNPNWHIQQVYPMKL